MLASSENLFVFSLFLSPSVLFSSVSSMALCLPSLECCRGIYFHTKDILVDFPPDQGNIFCPTFLPRVLDSAREFRQTDHNAHIRIIDKTEHPQINTLHKK